MLRSHASVGLALLAMLAAAGSAAAQTPVARQPITPASMQLHEFIYQQFPRELEARDVAIALAEHNVTYLLARVNSYRPFRSFGSYSPAFAADQLAQLELHAAVQQLECLRRQKDDLWREREAIVTAWVMAHASAAR